MKYLGLPLGAFFKSKVIWDGVVEKIEKKIGELEEDLHVSGWPPISNQEYVIQFA